MSDNTQERPEFSKRLSALLNEFTDAYPDVDIVASATEGEGVAMFANSQTNLQAALLYVNGLQDVFSGAGTNHNDTLFTTIMSIMNTYDTEDKSGKYNDVLAKIKTLLIEDMTTAELLK